MYKFTLLAIFLIVCIHWIYEPCEIDYNDAKIDKYRPSLNIQNQNNPTDSIRPIKTYFNNHNTAYTTLPAFKDKMVLGVRR